MTASASGDQPDNEGTSGLNDQDIEAMNQALAKLGLGHLRFAPEQVEISKSIGEELEKIMSLADGNLTEEEAVEEPSEPMEPGFGEVLGRRLGAFIRAAWATSRPGEQIPPAALIQLIGTYLAADRGEGLQ